MSSALALCVRLKSVGRDAFRLGGAQFALTSLVFGAVATALGASGPAAVVLGGGLALSSSAFVIQLLREKGELATRFGRASFGILLFQDIAVVPLLVVTPLLGGSSGAALGAALRVAAIKSASALAIIFVTGRLLLQRVFQLVASARDQTAFLPPSPSAFIVMSTASQPPSSSSVSFHCLIQPLALWCPVQHMYSWCVCCGPSLSLQQTV